MSMKKLPQEMVTMVSRDSENLDLSELSEAWSAFLRKYYWESLTELANSYPDKRSLEVKFQDIDNFSLRLAEGILNEPDIFLMALTEELRAMDLESGVRLDKAHVRIVNLPVVRRFTEISPEIAEGRLVSIEGEVLRVQKVEEKMKTAVFECPFCHHVFTVEQPPLKFEAPVECLQEDGGCGRKARSFKLLVGKCVTVKAQRFSLQEVKGRVKGEIKEIEVEDDLIHHVSQGDVVTLTGIVRFFQRKTPYLDWFIEVNSIIEKRMEDYDEETNEEAVKLIRDPNFFFELGKAFDRGVFIPKLRKARFVVGEECLKRCIPVVLTGARLGKPQIVRVIGSPATGKDSIARVALALLKFKSIERGYMTAGAMRYSESLRGTEILYLPEEDMSAGDRGREMRLMRADDGGLASEYVIRDPKTGEMTTKTQELEVKTILTTSNTIRINKALESGLWTFTASDDEKLTRKVKEEKLKAREERREILTDKDIAVWNCSFEILTRKGDIPDSVVIPYATKLMDFFDGVQTETRRDPDKLCDLIEIIAILRRYQKKESERNTADIIDLFTALRIGNIALKETNGSLTSDEETAYRKLKDLEVKKTVEQMESAKEESKKIESGITVKELSLESPFGYAKSYNLLEDLAEKGYATKDKKGRQNVYFIGEELKEPSKLRGTLLQSFNNPNETMKLCMRLVMNSSTLIENMKDTVVDPITGEEVNVPYISDGADEIETEGGENPKSSIGEQTIPHRSLSELRDDEKSQARQTREARKRLEEEEEILEPIGKPEDAESSKKVSIPERDSEAMVEKEELLEPFELPRGEQYDAADGKRIRYRACNLREDVCCRCGELKTIEYEMEKAGEREPICVDCIKEKVEES